MKRLALLVLLAGCGAPDPCERAPDEVAEPVRYTPRWAFEPWISKDISSTDDTYAFVEGFAARDIPVGAVVLDSPWETHYNTFVPNPVRYHDFDKLVRDLHARGILYAPDYAINAGGLVNVAQEVKGYDPKAARDRTMQIFDTIYEICDRSKKLAAPTYKVADIMVEEKLAAAARK